MKIDALQNLKDAASKDGKSIHDYSEVVKRLSGVTDKPLAGAVHVTPCDLNILLGVNAVKRQKLMADGAIPLPEFAYYGRWSARQVREILVKGIEKIEINEAKL